MDARDAQVRAIVRISVILITGVHHGDYFLLHSL